jgi:hypothetical protein
MFVACQSFSDVGGVSRSLGAAQADANLQGALEEPLHHQPWQATDHGQIGDERGELRPKLSRDTLGQRRPRQRSAGGTPPTMTAIFGDVRLNGRQLRHLMAPRVARLIARVQRPPAVATALGHQLDRRVHTLGGNHRPRVGGMSRLPARLAAALLSPASDALAAGESIGRGRLGSRGRILLLQGELSLEFGDSLLLVGVLSAKALVLFTEALKLARVALSVVAFGVSFARRPTVARHARYGTPIGSTCTAPLNCYVSSMWIRLFQKARAHSTTRAPILPARTH